MANGYYDEYEERLLTGGSETKYEEDPRTVEEPETETRYPLPPAIRSRSLKWSVISLVAGIISILICPFYLLGFLLVVVTGLTTAVARYNLGFFEKISTVGMILGIVGLVCNIFSLVIQTLGLFG